MDIFSLQANSFLGTVMFIVTISMHLFKKNAPITILYALQSGIVSMMLMLSSLHVGSPLLMLVAGITFVVKVLMVPTFFLRLVKKHHLMLSVSSYLNGPLTVIAIALLTVIPFSDRFRSLSVLAPDDERSLYLAIAMMLISVFLIINRRGALSQMIGVLSLENSIVFFASIAGLESTAGPQIGILFDIAVWVVIASVFGSMMYKHFGSLNVNTMNTLKEE
jgi:hydrogenase-4 component E